MGTMPPVPPALPPLPPASAAAATAAASCATRCTGWCYFSSQRAGIGAQGKLAGPSMLGPRLTVGGVASQERPALEGQAVVPALGAGKAAGGARTHRIRAMQATAGKKGRRPESVASGGRRDLAAVHD